MTQMSIGWVETLLAILLLLGDSGELSDYLNTEMYWTDRGVEITVSSMLSHLTPPEQKGKQLAGWVRQLGAAAYADREEASRRLSDAGGTARPLLEEAMQSSDPEVRMRARELLENLPEVDEEERKMRSRVAVLTLAGMNSMAARAALEEVASGQGPLASLAAEQVLNEEDSGPKEPLEERVVLSEADVLMQLRKEISVEPGAMLREVRNSPTLQEHFLTWWGTIGNFRIRRLTLSADLTSVLDSFPGRGLLWIEGSFDSAMLQELLTTARFTREENRTYWTKSDLTVMVDSDGARLGVFVDSVGDPKTRVMKVEDALLGRGENRLSPKIRDAVPAEDAALIRAVSVLPAEFPPLQKPDLAPETAILLVNYKQKDLAFHLEVLSADTESAVALENVLREDLENVREQVAGENGTAAAMIRDMLETVKVQTEGRMVHVDVELTEEAQLKMIRQVERFLAMMVQIQRQHRLRRN